jgi:redox-sensitive bicupin YhaK (pirin superfamily)
MITIRKPEDIYQAAGDIQNGTFHGRWHFSFEEYHDLAYMQFGTLRVFNDDTLSRCRMPLHYHREIEVVTYCASGEFRHEDEQDWAAFSNRMGTAYNRWQRDVPL